MRPVVCRWLALSFSVMAMAACGGAPSAVEPVPGKPVEPLPVLTSMTVVAPGDSLAAGQGVPLSVAASDQKARPMTVGFVSWTSSNPVVARMGADGVLLCLSPGTVTIAATVGEVTGRRTLTITARPPGPLPVASVEVRPYAIELDIGDTRQMTRTLRDFAGDTLDGRDVTWTTSNDSIAIVSADGVVTASGKGVAIIEANSEGRHGAVQVTVREPVDLSVVVAIAQPIPNVVLADSLDVIATAHGSFPIDSVILYVSGQRARMGLTPIGALGNGIGYRYVMDIAALPFGAHSIVVTAYDSRGKFGIKVQPFVHDPKLEGGGSRPVGGAK